MSKTIIVLSAASGYGHIRAGDIITDYLSSATSQFRVKHLNLCDFTPFWQKWVIERGWEISSTSKWLRPVYSFLHRKITSSDFAACLVSFMYRNAGDRLAEAFAKDDVVAVVALHPSGVNAACHWRKRSSFALYVVATDFFVHSLQCIKGVDKVFAPKNAFLLSSRARQYLEEERLIETRVQMPNTKNITHDQNIKQHEGLRAVVSYGANAMNYRSTFNMISETVKEHVDVNFDFVCGFNKQYYKFLKENFREEIKQKRVRLFSFRKNIGNLYKEADFFIGKAGGLTLFEILSLDIKALIIDCLPGQEEYNLKYMVENDRGYDCRDKDAFFTAISRIKARYNAGLPIRDRLTERETSTHLIKICDQILFELVNQLSTPVSAQTVTKPQLVQDAPSLSKDGTRLVQDNVVATCR